VLGKIITRGLLIVLILEDNELRELTDKQLIKQACLDENKRKFT